MPRSNVVQPWFPGGNTAYLSKKNVANDSRRLPQTWIPNGCFQKKVGHEYIVNRGHLIAYSLSKGINITGKYNPSAQSGDQNNPKNLFTQTAYSNQRIQTRFETQVRDALKRGYKVVYKVQPIFKGHDLMARGVHTQAISTNGKLNFNVYLFNVQPGREFNYATGRSKTNLQVYIDQPYVR
ncbi:DNA/RNA non-specific endonuclease [Lactobacillus sp. Sy-1]|uniref:DNA/RNA non-specific endonuclease n=1 Tax=Lactobacillus sp. Sy-1 TaxID=2109645 RepID=UPI00210783D3|nr:DNA/RNA non-specific endonuclease [Lactobacillus sp. Sy-1]